MTFFARLEYNKDNICKVLCSVSFFVFLMSVGLQVYFSNRSVIKSSEMGNLSEKKALLQEEVLSLNQQITVVSCLSNVEKLARERGFVNMEGPLLVVKPSAVALAR